MKCNFFLRPQSVVDKLVMVIQRYVVKVAIKAYNVALKEKQQLFYSIKKITKSEFLTSFLVYTIFVSNWYGIKKIIVPINGETGVSPENNCY